MKKDVCMKYWFFPLLKICMYMTVPEEIMIGMDAR